MLCRDLDDEANGKDKAPECYRVFPADAIRNWSTDQSTNQGTNGKLTGSARSPSQQKRTYHSNNKTRSDIAEMICIGMRVILSDSFQEIRHCKKA